MVILGRISRGHISSCRINSTQSKILHERGEKNEFRILCVFRMTFILVFSPRFITSQEFRHLLENARGKKGKYFFFTMPLYCQTGG